MSEKIKVEIFLDDLASSSPDANIIHEGLEKIAHQINSNPFEVIGDTRKLRISHDPSRPINILKTNWPRLEADYAIVLTDRNIVGSTPNETLGSAVRYRDRNHINGLAVIKATAIQPEIITAHEVGHLMGVEYPLNSEFDMHCASPDCLMHDKVRYEHISERIPKKGFRGLLERLGYVPAEYIDSERHAAQSFCTPCQEQLAKKAFFSLKYLNGESVSPTWL